MKEHPTFYLGHIIACGFFFGMCVLCVAGVEEVIGVVTPYEPVILRTLEADNRSH